MAECCCGEKKVKLIYSCSGAANTGYLADAVSRKLTESLVGNMTCLAAIAAEFSGFIESAKCARNIIIDGCAIGCGEKVFEKKGLPYERIVMTDFGVKKGKTEISQEVID